MQRAAGRGVAEQIGLTLQQYSSVAFAPKMSALFVVKDPGGSPRGVTADLGNELAQRLGVPIEFMVAPNTVVLTDALASAAIDVAFMPVDEERKSDWNSDRPIASSKALAPRLFRSPFMPCWTTHQLPSRQRQ